MLGKLDSIKCTKDFFDKTLFHYIHVKVFKKNKEFIKYDPSIVTLVDAVSFSNDALKNDDPMISFKVEPPLILEIQPFIEKYESSSDFKVYSQYKITNYIDLKIRVRLGLVWSVKTVN